MDEDGELFGGGRFVSVLLQAAHHATEHRQQIATILTILGHEAPEPDVWAYWDIVREGR